MRGQRIPRLEALRRSAALGAQTEDHTRRDLSLGRHSYGVQTERQDVQVNGIALAVVRKIYTEIRQCEIGDGDSGRQVFEVDYGVLQL